MAAHISISHTNSMMYNTSPRLAAGTNHSALCTCSDDSYWMTSPRDLNQTKNHCNANRTEYACQPFDRYSLSPYGHAPHANRPQYCSCNTSTNNSNKFSTSERANGMMSACTCNIPAHVDYYVGELNVVNSMRKPAPLPPMYVCVAPALVPVYAHSRPNGEAGSDHVGVETMDQYADVRAWQQKHMEQLKQQQLSTSMKALSERRSTLSVTTAVAEADSSTHPHDLSTPPADLSIHLNDSSMLRSDSSIYVNDSSILRNDSSNCLNYSVCESVDQGQQTDDFVQPSSLEMEIYKERAELMQGELRRQEMKVKLYEAMLKRSRRETNNLRTKMNEEMAQYKEKISDLELELKKSQEQHNNTASNLYLDSSEKEEEEEQIKNANNDDDSDTGYGTLDRNRDKKKKQKEVGGIDLLSESLPEIYLNKSLMLEVNLESRSSKTATPPLSPLSVLSPLRPLTPVSPQSPFGGGSTGQLHDAFSRSKFAGSRSNSYSFNCSDERDEAYSPARSNKHDQSSQSLEADTEACSPQGFNHCGETAYSLPRPRQVQNPTAYRPLIFNAVTNDDGHSLQSSSSRRNEDFSTPASSSHSSQAYSSPGLVRYGDAYSPLGSSEALWEFRRGSEAYSSPRDQSGDEWTKEGLVRRQLGGKGVEGLREEVVSKDHSLRTLRSTLKQLSAHHDDLLEKYLCLDARLKAAPQSSPAPKSATSPAHHAGDLSPDLLASVQRSVTDLAPLVQACVAMATGRPLDLSQLLAVSGTSAVAGRGGRNDASVLPSAALERVLQLHRDIDALKQLMVNSCLSLSTSLVLPRVH